MKVVLLTDPHKGDVADGVHGIGTQDGDAIRVYSDADAVLAEAAKAAVLFNADVFVLDGDNVDGNSTGGSKAAFLNTILTSLKTNLKKSIVYTMDAASTDNDTFTISDDGDLSNVFAANDTIISEDGNNDNLYTIESVSYSAPDFTITVVGEIRNAVAAGTITKIVMPLMVFGNHDHPGAGADTTFINLQTQYSSVFGPTNSTQWKSCFGLEDAVPNGEFWPGAVKIEDFSNYRYRNGKGFSFICLMGRATFGTAPNDLWNNTGITYDTGNTNAITQFDYLIGTTASTGLTAASTDHVIVLCHEHLGDSEGFAALPAAILSSGGTNVQGTLGGHGQKVTALSGHLHRVRAGTQGQPPVRKDTIQGVDYMSFRGSVLGKFPGDTRHSSFFLLEFNDITGVLDDVRSFQNSSSYRDRYNPSDIDNVSGDDSRGRERYSCF